MVLENIHDPHNASAVLRSCDAFGIGTIALCYTTQTFPKISNSVAAQVQKWLQLERYHTVHDCADALHQRGLTIFATRIDQPAHDYTQIDWTQPCAIVLGNEHHGVSEPMLNAADHAVTIPMQGFVDSLNVSVAAAVILSELQRQRRHTPTPWTNTKTHLYHHWLNRETHP